MSTVLRTSGPRRNVGRMAVAALSTIALFGAGATEAGAAPSSAAATPALAQSTGRLTVSSSPGTTLLRVAQPAPAAPAGSGGQATPRIFGLCNKRLWSSKYMRVSTAKTLVQSFVRAIRIGKGAGTALGVGAGASGIGAPAGAAISVISQIAGDFLIDLVTNRLVAHFDHYRQIRFQLQIKCSGLKMYPTIRLGGKAKF